MSTGQGNIPDDVIEEVLAKSDIVDTVSKYVHLTKQEIPEGLVPVSLREDSFLYGYAGTPNLYCYGRGKGGNAIKFRMEIEGFSFPEAVKTMAEENDISLPEGQGVPVIPRNPEKNV